MYTVCTRAYVRVRACVRVCECVHVCARVCARVLRSGKTEGARTISKIRAEKSKNHRERMATLRAVFEY